VSYYIGGLRIRPAPAEYVSRAYYGPGGLTMKSLVTFTVGAGLVLSSLLTRGGGAAPCLYYAETPYGTEAYYGLEDAQEALRAVGVDYRNTPSGYDIVSKAGC
jgi:hypothetical protein